MVLRGGGGAVNGGAVSNSLDISKNSHHLLSQKPKTKSFQKTIAIRALFLNVISLTGFSEAIKVLERLSPLRFDLPTDVALRIFSVPDDTEHFSS